MSYIIKATIFRVNSVLFIVMPHYNVATTKLSHKERCPRVCHTTESPEYVDATAENYGLTVEEF